jgi:hypothetical protein
MSKCFRIVKSSIFIGALLVCILVIFVPKTLSDDSNNNLIIEVTPKQSYKETIPGQRVTFDIDLENLGDERVRIISNILELPDGWNAYTESSIVLGSKTLDEDSISTISFVVQTPDEFGYHDESVVLSISFTPFSYMNPSIKGGESILNFNVRNRGWAPNGFDTVLIITTLIAILVAVFLIIKKRWK